MCCCGTPTINGQLGYKWQPNDAPSVRQPYPPQLEGHETLLYDEPGRCGGIDAHCHHYRVVKNLYSVYLLVQHGGGRESFRLSTTSHFMSMLAALDSTQRYWLLHALYYANRDGKEVGREKESAYYRTAFLEGRMKRRKKNGSYRVEVLPKMVELKGEAVC